MLADVQPAAGGERVVRLGAELDPGHVAQVDDLPGPAGLDDDPLELLRVGQPAEGGDGHLERAGRTGSAAGRPARPRPGRSAARRAAITSSVVSCAGRELVRVEPDPHGVRPDAADHHVADPVHPAQLVAQPEGGVVRQEQPVVRAGQGVHPGRRPRAGRRRARRQGESRSCRPRPGRWGEVVGDGDAGSASGCSSGSRLGLHALRRERASTASAVTRRSVERGRVERQVVAGPSAAGR